MEAERRRVAGEESKKAAGPVAKQITDLRQQVEDKSKKLGDRRGFGFQLRPVTRQDESNSRVELVRPGRANVLQVIDVRRRREHEVVNAVVRAAPEIRSAEFHSDNLAAQNEPVQVETAWSFVPGHAPHPMKRRTMTASIPKATRSVTADCSRRSHTVVVQSRIMAYTLMTSARAAQPASQATTSSNQPRPSPDRIQILSTCTSILKSVENTRVSSNQKYAIPLS